MVTTGTSTTSEMVYVYKKDDKITFAKSKLVKRFPNGNCIGAFGGVCQGKVIAGFEKDVYEYNCEEDEWRQVQKDVKHDRTCAKSCSIGEMLLVVGPELGNRSEIIRFVKDDPHKKIHPSPTKSKRPETNPDPTNDLGKKDIVNDATISTKESKICHAKEFLRPQQLCETPLPLKVKSCSLTNLGNGQVMLIECNKACLIGRLSSVVKDLKGGLEDEDVVWCNHCLIDIVTIDPYVFRVSSMKSRYEYIIFKMQRSVYVTGGFDGNEHPLVSCVYFDLALNAWYTFKYSLPFPLCNASVVVSADERFAIITGGKVDPDDSEEDSINSIILFTEDEGFRILQNSSLINKRSSHVSIIIP